MPLTPLQAGALNTLDWLLSSDDGERRTGRSTLIAIVLIRQAARNPGRTVSYVDHLPHQENRRYVCEIIRDLLHSDPRFDQRAVVNRDNFRLNLAAPIPNWLPPGFELPALPQRPQGSRRSRYDRLRELA